MFPDAWRRRPAAAGAEQVEGQASAGGTLGGGSAGGAGETAGQAQPEQSQPRWLASTAHDNPEAAQSSQLLPPHVDGHAIGGGGLGGGGTGGGSEGLGGGGDGGGSAGSGGEIGGDRSVAKKLKQTEATCRYQLSSGAHVICRPEVVR